MWLQVPPTATLKTLQRAYKLSSRSSQRNVVWSWQSRILEARKLKLYAIQRKWDITSLPSTVEITRFVSKIWTLRSKLATPSLCQLACKPPITATLWLKSIWSPSSFRLRKFKTWLKMWERSSKFSVSPKSSLRTKTPRSRPEWNYLE